MRTIAVKLFISGFCSIMICLIATPADGQRLTERKIKRVFDNSEIVNDHYTGFVLYDQRTDKVIYELNSNKPSVPASNTKLFTLYTALRMLGDSIPGLRYIVKGDSLIFWGTGDPSLFHPDLKSAKVFNFLKNSPQKLFYSGANYIPSSRSGSFSLQTELTSFPIGENTAVIFAGADGNLKIIPSSLARKLRQDTSYHPKTFTIRRDASGIGFSYPLMQITAGFKKLFPIRHEPDIIAGILQDTLKKPVGFIEMPMPQNAATVYSLHSDSLYKRMMLPSDNYLAEQILLMCSSVLPGPLSLDSTIAYSSKNYLNDLPDKFQWTDGSGLSRYNLFSPRSIIKMLVKIRDKVGNEQRLLNMFPAGGISGTLKNAYKTDNGVPFVWAKTGTLSNVHLQGGYLVTRKGKKLIYSFMNNNFLRTTSEIRDEMGRIITDIHNRY